MSVLGNKTTTVGNKTTGLVSADVATVADMTSTAIATDYAIEAIDLV